MPIEMLDVDFASGQAPEDPDNVATLVRVEAKISGKDLARMVHKQERVLDRYLDKVHPRRLLVHLLSQSELDRLAYYAVGFVKKYLWDEFQDRDTTVEATMAEESDLPYVLKVNPRDQSITVEVEFDVVGD